MGKILQIAKDLGLLQAADSENFNESEIELTPEETEKMLAVALRTKRANAYSEWYGRKLLKENVMPKISSEQLLRIVIRKGENEIPDFKLSTAQILTYLRIAQYFNNDPEFESDSLSLKKGLMLFGGVGSGKTTIMKLFCHNPKASYVMKSCRTIAGDYAKGGEDTILQYCGQYFPTMMENDFKTESWGLCFDDLGTEEVRSHFKNSMNVMERILLDRYENLNKIPYRTHLTTNLNTDQIEEFYGMRVRSRMREMFNVIEVIGEDMR